MCVSGKGIHFPNLSCFLSESVSQSLYCSHCFCVVKVINPYLKKSNSIQPKQSFQMARFPKDCLILPNYDQHCTKYGTLGRRLWQPWNLRKYVYWKEKYIMLVVTEVNNFAREWGQRWERAYKSLVYCAFPNVWLYLANLGQSFFFLLLLLVCQQAQLGLLLHRPDAESTLSIQTTHKLFFPQKVLIW